MAYLQDLSINPAFTNDQVNRLYSYFTCLKTQVDEEAKLGNENTLDETLESGLMATSEIIASSSQPFEEIAVQVRSQWYTAFQAAKNYDWYNDKQYRLVWLVLSIRELGSLSRPSFGVAQTSGGQIWSDLPFFVPDATSFMEDTLHNGTETQRKNFAAFLAKLADVGICGNKLSGCLLILLRQALETTRPLEVYDGSANLPVSHYVPMILGWMTFGVRKTNALSVHSFDTGLHAEVFEPGHLAKEAGVQKPGFSPERWAFWRDKLHQIGLENVNESIYAESNWRSSALSCVGIMNESAGIFGGILDVPSENDDYSSDSSDNGAQ
jgi:hypothetical protein